MKNLYDLCNTHQVLGVYNHPSGLVGIKKGEWFIWFRYANGSYAQSGETRTKENASFHRVIYPL